MKDMLIKEKQEIEENEDRDIDLEVVHYRQDKDCKLAGKTTNANITTKTITCAFIYPL